MKVRLVFETEIDTPVDDTTQNIGTLAVAKLVERLEEVGGGMEFTIFKKMTVNGSCKAPGLK